MAKRKGWFLVAYDIAEPRRLRRMHRVLRKRAMPVQKSVFFYHGTEGALRRLLDELGTLMNPREDDLRAWPVDPLDTAWIHGSGVNDNLVTATKAPPWWHRLLGALRPSRREENE